MVRPDPNKMSTSKSMDFRIIQHCESNRGRCNLGEDLSQDARRVKALFILRSLSFENCKKKNVGEEGGSQYTSLSTHKECAVMGETEGETPTGDRG